MAEITISASGRKAINLQTKKAPSDPTHVNTMHSKGNETRELIILGNITKEYGDTPKNFIADICFDTTILPVSAEILEPTLLIKIRPVRTGLSSLVNARMTITGTDSCAPNRSRPLFDCRAKTAPVKKPVNETREIEKNPMSKNCMPKFLKLKRRTPKTKDLITNKVKDKIDLTNLISKPPTLSIEDNNAFVLLNGIPLNYKLYLFLEYIYKYSHQN